MTATKSLNCLTCGTTLEQREEHGVTIDYCPECSGVWLDPGELEALTGHSSHSHGRDVDIDFEGDEEEQEEEGGILSTIAGALGGEEGEFEEEAGFEEEEEF